MTAQDSADGSVSQKPRRAKPCFAKRGVNSVGSWTVPASLLRLASVVGEGTWRGVLKSARVRRYLGTVGLVILALAACGCSSDPKPLPHDAANRARDAIASYARDTADQYPKFTRGAGVVVANHDCFASEHGRVYCEVSFESFPDASDRYCATGFTARADGSDVRHVRVGDPKGPGWECGTGDAFG